MADQDPTPVVIPPKSPAANAPRRHRPRLLDTALLGPSRRRKLIKEIEVATGRRLLCYVSPWVNIATPDAFDLIRLLQKVHSGASITLLLDSPGGEIDPAEKMVDLLQKACQSPSGPNGDLEVVIPYQAKSAATLIALGADRIMMSDSSELGPIDPLLSSVPAVPLLRAYKKAEERCIRYPDNQAFVEEFRSFHPVIVEMMRLAVSRSRLRRAPVEAAGRKPYGCACNPSRRRPLPITQSDDRLAYGAGHRNPPSAALGPAEPALATVLAPVSTANDHLRRYATSVRVA